MEVINWLGNNAERLLTGSGLLGLLVIVSYGLYKVFDPMRGMDNLLGRYESALDRADTTIAKLRDRIAELEAAIDLDRNQESRECLELRAELAQLQQKLEECHRERTRLQAKLFELQEK